MAAVLCLSDTACFPEWSVSNERKLQSDIYVSNKYNQQMFETYFWQQYNILDKRTVGQRTPDITLQRFHS